MSIEELERLMQEPEGTNLEFKEARNSCPRPNVLKYCAALANGGGGYFVLGVTDRRPRQVVGSQAFLNVNAELNDLRESLRPPPSLEAYEIPHPQGRVLVFKVGSRRRGQVIRYGNIPWSRVGESLVSLSNDELRDVLLEDTDASAEPCPEATLRDLDPHAFEVFRDGIVSKTIDERQRRRYATMPREDLLRDIGLMRDGVPLHAAVLLLGTEAALRAWSPNAEVIFEYRRSPHAIRYEQRVPLRRAILLAIDDLWDVVRAYAYQNPVEVMDRTKVIQFPRFPERSIREALLNAVTHRDYHDSESVLVNMTPEQFSVTSPGPFPATITPENVADKQYRRNRILAEALEKCGRIERSGQGIDLMIQAAVRQAQALPTFEEPGGRQVRVTLHSEVDVTAAPVLLRIPNEMWDELGVSHLVALDAVRQGLSRRYVDPNAARFLIERDLIEPGGTGDAPYVFHARLREGLTATPGFRLARVMQALFDNKDGATFSKLAVALPDLTVDELKRNLQWLKRQGLVYTTGRTRGARWHVVRGIDTAD